MYVASKSFRAFSTEKKKKNRTLRRIKNYYLQRRLGRPRRPPWGFRGSARRDNRVPSLVVQITRDLRLPRRALPTSTSSSLRTSVVQSLGSSPATHTHFGRLRNGDRSSVYFRHRLWFICFISSRDFLSRDRRKKYLNRSFLRPTPNASFAIHAHSRRLRNGDRRRYIPPPPDATDFDSFVFYIFSKFRVPIDENKYFNRSFLRSAANASFVFVRLARRIRATADGLHAARDTAESCKWRYPSFPTEQIPWFVKIIPNLYTEKKYNYNN